MTGRDIQKYIKPYMEEMFEGYVIVGFSADAKKPVIIGNAPHPLKHPEESRKIKKIAKYAYDNLGDEKNTQGLGNI